ncbi:MAG: 3-phosphoshikimate 1-carboxyvinyltransferase, partial [Nitrospinota bacterium]
PLLDALSALGARAFSTRGNGCLPAVVRGRLKGGKARVAGITSQYTTSLLINCPLGEGDTELTVDELRERPYVEMTLWWLERQGIRYERDDWERFFIPGGQAYRPFREEIPSDFSSAAFFLGAAAITGSTITLRGLNMEDPQGDKALVEYLREMGTQVEEGEGGILVKGGELRGVELDLNDSPDLLPVLAVLGARADGKTVLRNVPQARLKETDRIAVMSRSLCLLGAKASELPDGLVVEGSELKGTSLQGFGDHRVVMALAVAGLAAEGRTEVDSAEAISITFPNFVELMRALGAAMELKE